MLWIMLIFSIVTVIGCSICSYSLGKMQDVKSMVSVAVAAVMVLITGFWGQLVYDELSRAFDEQVMKEQVVEEQEFEEQEEDSDYTLTEYKDEVVKAVSADIDLFKDGAAKTKFFNVVANDSVEDLTFAEFQFMLRDLLDCAEEDSLPTLLYVKGLEEKYKGK